MSGFGLSCEPAGTLRSTACDGSMLLHSERKDSGGVWGVWGEQGNGSDGVGVVCMQYQPTILQKQPDSQNQMTHADQTGTTDGTAASSNTTAAQTLDASGSGHDAKVKSTEHLSQVLIVVGLMGMMLIIFRLLKKNARNRRLHRNEQNTRPTPQPTPSHISASTATRDRIEQLMSDAEELTRRLAAHMDNKAAHLETLLAQTEDRIAELERLMAVAAGHDGTTQPTDPPRVPTPDQSRSPGAPHDRSQREDAGPIDPLHRRVYGLADEGCSAIDIARKLDRPTGQIELILALRKTAL